MLENKLIDRSQFMKAGIAALLIPLLGGCASNKLVNNVVASYGYIKISPQFEQLSSRQPMDLERFLKLHFKQGFEENGVYVPGVYDKIKDIPLYEGFILPGSLGYAMGSNWSSSLVGIISGYKEERAVVVSSKYLENLNNGRFNESCIIHEYLHHIDDLGFINHELFDLNYKKMKREKYNEIESNYIDGLLNSRFLRSSYYLFLEKFLGLSTLQERIAYVGSRMALGYNYPNYMKKVFKDVLTFKFKKEILIIK